MTETMETHCFGKCPSGSWRDCPNAYQTHENGYPTMRCKHSNMHPDYCENASKTPDFQSQEGK